MGTYELLTFGKKKVPEMPTRTKRRSADTTGVIGPSVTFPRPCPLGCADLAVLEGESAEVAGFAAQSDAWPDFVSPRVAGAGWGCSWATCFWGSSATSSLKLSSWPLSWRR